MPSVGLNNCVIHRGTGAGVEAVVNSHADDSVSEAPNPTMR